jgi:hypothetical protein
MMNRTTSFVVGALTCLVAGTSFVTIHLGDAGAADECLAAPKQASAPGQHWYYRIDRATQRHCWYLGDAGKAASRTAKAASAHRSTLTDSDREADSDRETALARSSNVRAEMPMPQMSRDDGAKVAAAAPVAPVAADSGNAAQQSTPGVVASEAPAQSDVWRALDAANFKASASEPPKPSASVAASTMADATQDTRQDAKSDSDSASAASAAPAAAPAVAPPSVAVVPPAIANWQAPAMGRATSLSALFLAAFGALIFVTLAAALAYFFTDRTRSREVDGGLSLPQDWPPEPFRLPSSLKLLAHGSFVDESAPLPGREHQDDDPRAGMLQNGQRDSDVHQIEQLLTRVVRRSENLRGQIANATSPGPA